jgi:hypothetical protein
MSKQRTKEFLERSVNSITPGTYKGLIRHLQANGIGGIETRNNDLLRVYAEVAAPRIARHWVGHYGLTLMKHPCLRHLATGKPPWTGGRTFEKRLPAGDDHSSMWAYQEDPRTPVVYVSQPYGLTFEEMQKIVEFCEKWGLTASIGAGFNIWHPNWHFPGAVLSIVVTRKEQDLKPHAQRITL